jgi:RHS repeat-associated protein
VTATSAGANQADLRYRAYGLARLKSGTQKTPYRYTGQRIEAGIDLYYYGARWYDPVVGRFLQADTIVPEPGNPQSLNRYTYVLNNPLKYTDPSGHAEFLDSDAIYRVSPSDRLIIAERVSKSGVGALINRVRAGSEQAQVRMHDVLNEAKSGGLPGLRTGGTIGGWRGDAGFRSDFQDEYVYTKRGYAAPYSKQIGHFLTAVNMGKGGVGPEKLRMQNIMAHELTGDLEGSAAIGSILWQLGQPARGSAAVFTRAVNSYEAGDIAAMKTDLGKWFEERSSSGLGNSVEDLCLSVAGWSLGRQIRDSVLRTNQDVAIWMAEHLASNYR